MPTAVSALCHSGELPAFSAKGVETLIIETFVFGFVFESPLGLALISPANSNERKQKHEIGGN